MVVILIVWIPFPPYAPPICNVNTTKTNSVLSLYALYFHSFFSFIVWWLVRNIFLISINGVFSRNASDLLLKVQCYLLLPLFPLFAILGQYVGPSYAYLYGLCHINLLPSRLTFVIISVTCFWNWIFVLNI